MNSGTPDQRQNILVINSGSSSIKFAVFDMSERKAVLTGLAERLHGDTPEISWKGSDSGSDTLNAQGHQAGFSYISDLLKKLNLLDTVSGVGHRVVHGGEHFSDSVLIDDESLKTLKTLNHLAPLHNPVNVEGIEASQAMLPDLPQVAVFDTAFHQSMEEQTYLYAVPYEWYSNHGVRRYGFHGTSYRYVVKECARRLNKPLSELNILCAHLGNGCSASAILGGRSIDTSMGLTPLEGLAMGTRSGNVDPGLIEFMANAESMSVGDIMQTLNKKSGLLGLSGISNDMRSLLEAEASGNEQATRAINTFCYRVARELAALSAALPDIDALVFTGGIGEHAVAIRERIIGYWKNAGFSLDTELNHKGGNELGVITTDQSPRAMVIATNEELMIAEDTYGLCKP